MDLEAILRELREERHLINEAIAVLEKLGKRPPRSKAAPVEEEEESDPAP